MSEGEKNLFKPKRCEVWTMRKKTFSYVRGVGRDQRGCGENEFEEQIHSSFHFIFATCGTSLATVLVGYWLPATSPHLTSLHFISRLFSSPYRGNVSAPAPT